MDEACGQILFRQGRLRGGWFQWSALSKICTRNGRVKRAQKITPRRTRRELYVRSAWNCFVGVAERMYSPSSRRRRIRFHDFVICEGKSLQETGSTEARPFAISRTRKPGPSSLWTSIAAQ